ARGVQVVGGVEQERFGQACEVTWVPPSHLGHHVVCSDKPGYAALKRDSDGAQRDEFGRGAYEDRVGVPEQCVGSPSAARGSATVGTHLAQRCALPVLY